jgi:transcription antitermination factor NusG
METPYLSEDGEALSTSGDLTRLASGGLTAGALPADAGALAERRWFAAYTAPRHEKSVARHPEVRAVEYFLPLHRVTRRWKNGCDVSVDFPVFPSYVFVRSERRDVSRLLNVPGLLTFVGAGRIAAAMPNAEIDRLRAALPLRKHGPHPFLTAGCKVRIVAGPLTGACGVLLRSKNLIRVVISVELICQSVAVEVGADEVEVIR